MNIVLWLVLGGITGLVISLVGRTDRRATLYRNVLVGALAALAAGWLTAPLTGGSESFRAGDLDLTWGSMLIAIAGAAVVVTAVQLLRGSEERRIREKTRAQQ